MKLIIDLPDDSNRCHYELTGGTNGRFIGEAYLSHSTREELVKYCMEMFLCAVKKRDSLLKHFDKYPNRTWTPDLP